MDENRKAMDGMQRVLTPEERRSIRLRLWAAAGAFGLFAVIAFLVQTGRTKAFDTAVDYAVYSLRGPVTNAFFTHYTHLGDAVCLVILLAVLILVPVTRWKIGVPAGMTGLLGVALFKIMKPLFARPRPDEALRLISQGGFSFPSGHSMNGLICLGVIAFLLQRAAGSLHLSRRVANLLSVLLVAEALGIGFSRIFVGVHYITDVLGGFSFGLGYLMVATVVIDRWGLNGLSPEKISCGVLWNKKEKKDNR